MRWAKVREKAKKYAPLIALLYFFFLLNGERHENHVLQSELAQLDHHLEMEFTSTKDFLAGNLSSPDYHDSMIWEAEQLRTIASCGYYFQSSGFGADDAWLEVFSELSQFVQSPESFQQLTPQERETLAAFLNDYSYQNEPGAGAGGHGGGLGLSGRGAGAAGLNGGPCAPHRPHAPAPDGRQNLILLAVPVILCAHLIYDKHKGKSS